MWQHSLVSTKHDRQPRVKQKSEIQTSLVTLVYSTMEEVGNGRDPCCITCLQISSFGFKLDQMKRRSSCDSVAVD